MGLGVLARPSQPHRLDHMKLALAEYTVLMLVLALTLIHGWGNAL